MQRENEVQHVFLVGAKSLGAYGGVAVIIGTLKSSLFSPLEVQHDEKS